MSRRVAVSQGGSEQSFGRSPLGLGPLETAIMQALWDAGGWVNLPLIRDSMKYHRTVAYNTTATVISILCDKGLAHRELGDRDGHSGSGVWWYRAAQPQAEHIGSLIASLLDYSASPSKTLAHALATTRTTIDLNGSAHSCPPAPSGTGVADGKTLAGDKDPGPRRAAPGNARAGRTPQAASGNGGEVKEPLYR